MSVESTVLSLIKEPILKLGYTDVSVSYKKESGAFYLRVTLDKDDVISLDDIVLVNDLISPILDEADVISNEYILDVTSLGAEKPISIDRLDKYVTKYVNIHLSHPYKGENILEGTLIAVSNGTVTIELRDKARKFNVELPRKDIDKARLAIKF